MGVLWPWPRLGLRPGRLLCLSLSLLLLLLLLLGGHGLGRVTGTTSSALLLELVPVPVPELATEPEPELEQVQFASGLNLAERTANDTALAGSAMRIIAGNTPIAVAQPETETASRDCWSVSQLLSLLLLLLLLPLLLL